MTDDTTGAPKFLVYPTLAYTPETKWEFGLVNLWLFHAKRNYQNRLNEINTFTFYTQQGQYGIWLDHAIYTDKDDWFFLGRGRFQYFPLKYYGIGTDAPTDYKVVNNSNVQFRERVLRKVKENFYVGLQYDFHKIYNVSFSQDVNNSNLGDLKGGSGSTNSGIGFGLVYDDRKNVLNVRKGIFAELAYLNYTNILGSDYLFNSFQYDARIYRKGFAKNQVIALQANGMANYGDIPFNMLALMGGESMMRGYYLGRFRDNAMVNLQAEYRFLPLPFSKTIGASFFASVGNVAPNFREIEIQKTKWAAGLGLRYLIFKAKDIYVRSDFAFTEEGSGFYLFIGEAF